jgi:metallo-beta-lactamase family protein
MAEPLLTFHGAAGSVTGSCFRLQLPGSQVLIDCGMFQGSKTEKALNYRDFPFDPRKVDAVILSHAHIDHSGLLPKLVRDGFAGPVHATPATRDLCSVMLPDSAYIQEIEVEHLNRRQAHAGHQTVEPIYSLDDVNACLELFRDRGYGEWFDVVPRLKARFWNAGHLLGSASVEIELAAGSGEPTRLLFSADVGPGPMLMHANPEGPAAVDYLICESTYGDTDRVEADGEQRRAVLEREIKDAMKLDGVLLIPSFAVERTQELISDLARLFAAGEIPEIPVYVDSPLATRATGIFARHARELNGGEFLLAGLQSKWLRFTETVEQSKSLDRIHGFHIVIAASGMCEAGRIRHRLKNWLWREEATVLLVGYQAMGTLGRLLLEGAPRVRIQGEEFAVRARIRSIDLYSGHADGPQLVEWIRRRLPLRHELFLVHGEEAAVAGLAQRLDGVVASGKIVKPVLDECFALGTAGARRLSAQPAPRIPPEKMGRLDWHNDVSRLILDINDALAAVPDERRRGVLIRRLRRALED